MSKQWPAKSGEGREQARQLYARAVVEHERVRRAGSWQIITLCVLTKWRRLSL